MTADFRRRWVQFWDAIAECKRAENEWSRLQAEGVKEVAEMLSEKERKHLSHTVFRINALLFLYSRLRGTAHSTRLGVLLGATTHLLDFVYDHPDACGASVETSEQVVLRGNGGADSLIDRTLGQLASEFWQLVADPATFRVRLDDMLETQRASMAQEDGKAIAPDELERLTEEKGHRSICLYFSAVNPTFSEAEAVALRRFGLYMQYMDDLEDLYEDRAERRTSPVPSPGRGAVRATLLLLAAQRDLRLHYASSYWRGYWIFMTWLSVFHLGILVGCGTREVTRRLPAPIGRLYDRTAERITERVPFLNVAPIGVSYYETPSPSRRLPMPVSLALTLPVAMASLWKDGRAYVRAFHEVVDPVIAATGDVLASSRLRQPLLEWGVKGAYMVGSYARLAELPAPVPLALLCGAAGRLYDDLLEQGADVTLPPRLTRLFLDEAFEPANHDEKVLLALYDEIHKRLERPRSDPVFGALLELHDYQRRTAHQRQTAISTEYLDDITYRKGGLTLEVMYGMARPAMPPEERRLIDLIGATLQLLDDYQDEFADRAAGVTTKATRGEIRGRDLLRRLELLEAKLAPYYGGHRTRRFVNELRIQTIIVALARRIARGAVANRRPKRRPPPGALRLLLRRGSNVAVQPAAVHPNGELQATGRSNGVVSPDLYDRSR